MFKLIFLILISSVASINNKCDDNIFILISPKVILLYNFDSQTDNSPSIIYQAKSNTTIENGLFHKRTNTIILLINYFNETYSILSLNIHNNLYDYWKEKPNDIIYSSYIYLTLGQQYLYLLNSQTMLLQIYTLRLKIMKHQEINLLNLPINQKIVNYIVDEKYQYLWIIFENSPFQLYICQLKTFSCYLYMNIYNLNKPIQFYINWKYEQFYLYSNMSLMIFNYNQNGTNYSIQNVNSTQQNFLTICEKTNQIEYISINYTQQQRQICYQTCQNLPFISNDTTHIHTIQRISTISNILHCSKQRRLSVTIMIILILIDLLVILCVIIWLAYKYFYQSKLIKHTSSGTICAVEKDSVTHF
ncbi:unnamed protein product [Adineta steineri]|uniref:Transmembrane protein n=1 Tax=Adineta steineri TaxID=433720 RepID=A0A819U3K8_9BILA|nr:unnamed protein product [Adineta steineri]CAF4088245.1 unnamed protein product [Adineta steineri]